MRTLHPALLLIAAVAVVAIFAIVAQSRSFFPGAAAPAAPAVVASPAGAAPPAAPPFAGQSQPIPVESRDPLVPGVNACTNPYTGDLVSTWDGVCEANLKIYQCYCPQGACRIDRTPGRERGDCTTPGTVHPVMAP